MESSARSRAIADEQRYVDTAYAALDRQRDIYEARLRDVRKQSGHESAGALSERDSFATHYEDNLTRLRNVENRLVMGRLDFEDRTEHIGRIGLKTDTQDVLLLDWRAPQAEPFYQATAADPRGVRRRRHIQTRFREVTGVEDELLGEGDTTDLNLTGEGALMAALSQARDGKMGDIVATIQTEQDRIIRADSAGVLVVQGGPGTGKTAVALHRAAYLLYAQRERLSRSGVLIIGPSPVFLKYIDQVLPSLGESDVVSATMGSLVPGIRATATDDAAVAEIKGRIVWKSIAKRAVRELLEKTLTRPVVLFIDGEKLLVRPRDVAAAQQKARRTGKPHNEARDTYAKAMVDELARQLAAAKETTLESSPWLVADVAGSRDARREINLRWLPSAATTLLERLYSRPDLLAAIAPELSAEDRAQLVRPKGSRWTEADVAILDELADHLGRFESPTEASRTRAQRQEAERLQSYVAETMDRMNLGGGIVDAQTLTDRVSEYGGGSTLADKAAADRLWTYGHVVVDEAQELSPMQWEMLIRRCPTHSMTVVGDLDQRPDGSPAGGWEGMLGRLGERASVQMLTVAYRTPATIIDAAARVMEAAGHPVRHVRAARDLPDALRASQGIDRAAIGKALAEEIAALDGLYGNDGGSVAIVAPAALVPDAVEAATTGPWSVDVGGTDLGARVHVLNALASKGLEYDSVIVVDPDAILEEGPGNLYVAMTRPTRRLTVLYADHAPQGLFHQAG